MRGVLGWLLIRQPPFTQAGFHAAQLEWRRPTSAMRRGHIPVYQQHPARTDQEMRRNEAKMRVWTNFSYSNIGKASALSPLQALLGVGCSFNIHI
eukprot:6311617-Amphidinium_carterae.1